MGTWFAKLAGHKDDAEKVLKDPHSIAAYTLLFGLALLILLLWFAIVIVTAIRVYKKYRQLDKEEKFPQSTTKTFVDKLRRRLSTYGVQEEEFQMVELTRTPGPASHSMQSSKLGIRLAGGMETNHIPGDPGIFVVNVRPRSIADGKLYPGDRIVSINDFYMGKVSLKYAKEVMHALRQAEGHIKFFVKRAPLREQRVNEAFTMYCDDEETGKKEVVFSKEHMEVFEEAFSVYDVRGSGKIPKKRFFELLRTLGYNIHKAEAYEYMNELELAEKTSITFNELVKFLEHVVGGQTANYEIQSVSNVFDHNQVGHVPVSELAEALESFYGSTLSSDVLQEILSLADLDKDGNVNKEDFERLLLPSLMLY